MFSNNSISISLSDDDLEEHRGRNQMRVHARRKRKRPIIRVKDGFAHRLLRKILRHWILLIMIAALGLLIFEASRIGRSKPSSELRSEVASMKKPFQAKLEGNKSNGNLNRLDPTSRVVGGVRERCLKLLGPEELVHLEIPINEESTGPVKRITYFSESRTSDDRGDTTMFRRNSTVTRFNLFTGNQTLDQRDNSLQVTESTEVHCGFYSKKGGFTISHDNEVFMQSCKVVVSTCTFGGGDDLYQPIGMSEASLQKVCYVAFWDEVTVSAQEAAGHKIEENGYIGKWRIVIVRDLPFVDQRLNGKIPKMLSHRLFPEAKYSIWVDSKSQFRRDPLGVLEALLWRTKSILAISEHGARSSVYDEANAVVRKHKATPEEVQVQLSQYQSDGLPKDRRFNGKKALCEASVIVKKHTPLTNLLMCLWFNEAVRFTSRDQLSLPYVLWRLKAFQNINMFPVCTRKDLVNSMGHLRKVKPLTVPLNQHPRHLNQAGTGRE